MKPDELKLRICNEANKLVDQYFAGETILERFMNATLKVIVKNNVGKLDTVMFLFKDADGNVDANEIINEYTKQLGDGQITFNLRDYIKDETIKNMLPDRTLTITKEDLCDILTQTVM